MDEDRMKNIPRYSDNNYDSLFRGVSLKRTKFNTRWGNY